MALQSSYTTKMGFTAPQAYSRITTYNGNKSGVRLTVETYFDVAAAGPIVVSTPATPNPAPVPVSANTIKQNATKGQPIAVNVFQLSLADGATMATMYDALSKLPQFAGAINV